MAERKKRTTKKKNTSLNSENIMDKLQILFIVILFLFFFAWAFKKCNNEKDPSSLIEEEDNTVTSPAAADNPDSPTYDLAENEINNTASNPPSNNGNTEVVGRGNNNYPTSKSYTPLYVTLEGLKVRKGPSLDSSIVSVLSLHDEVMFMEKRTDFREKINIGNEIYTTEPWFFIQTKKGHQGWVYGAGVHFFKWDRLKEPIREIGIEEEEKEE